MRALSGLMALVLLAACASTPAAPRAPTPGKPVDAARFYTGVWREIGRRPMSLTDGCVAGATRYTPAANGRIAVRDTCRQGTPSGRERAIAGPADILDPGRNAQLRVHYRFLGFIPITRDYWVLDHDDAYTWFISSDPSFTDLWIYTRDPRPDPALIDALKRRAADLGYDVRQLEFPPQP